MSTLSILPCGAGEEAVPAALTERSYRGILREYRRETLWIVRRDGAAAGWMHLHIPADTLYAGFLFIYIAPDQRRRGIGRALYRFAEERLRAADAEHWSSYPPSAAADGFARAMGFDYTGVNCRLVYEGGPLGMPADGIRPFREDDYPAAADIWTREYRKMHARIGYPDAPRTLSAAERETERADYLAKKDNYFIIEENGLTAGIGGIFADASGIGMLAVDERFAGRGMGTRLAAFLTDECIRRGQAKPELYCEEANEHAMRLYRALGYREISREGVALKRRPQAQ